MIKFSIIVPVYNTASYLNRCLDSILNQTYDNYEVIIVNDGSTDDSKKIINEYVKKYPKVVKQTNLKKRNGIAAARNKGIRKVTGDYILFVDSDDYIERGLLKTLSTKVKEVPDIIRFQVKEICGDKICMYRELPFETVKGDTAFKKLIHCHYVEKVWCYVYRTEFYKDNQFKFQEGKYHEDFGLLPQIILEASKVKAIGYIGYDRVMYGSKLSDYTYEEIKNRVNDYVEHYQRLMKFLNIKNIKNKDIFGDYFTNSLLIKLLDLNHSDYKYYMKEFKTMKVFDNLLAETSKQKLKKSMLKISPKFYYCMKRYHIKKTR